MSRRALTACCAVALALPATAAAHVTVTPDTAARGKPATLTFRVPNERAPARTTRVQVFFPSGAHVAAVTVAPHPGWRHAVQEGALESVDWSAATVGAEFGDGTVGRFTLSTGPLPKADRLVFKVLQTYSDGTVVRWIQEPQPGADPPERPAPTVELTASGGAHARAHPGSDWWIWVVVALGLWAVAGAAFLLLRRRR